MSKEAQLKYIASIVRAIVTSRKPPVELKFVLKDYFDVEGVPLPFKQLGYDSPLQLIEDTGEFTSRDFYGETCIFANFSQKTAHIESMIKNQKKAKTGSFHTPRPLTRKSSGGLVQRTNHPYNRSSGGGGALVRKPSGGLIQKPNHHPYNRNCSSGGGSLGYRASSNSHLKRSTNLGRWPSASSNSSARNITVSFQRPNTDQIKSTTKNITTDYALKEVDKKSEFQVLRDNFEKLQLEAKRLRECNIILEKREKEFQKKLDEQNALNNKLNEKISLRSTNTVMQSSSSSLVKSPLEQERNEDISHSTKNNKTQQCSNNNTSNNNNNTKPKSFDLRDKLNEARKQRMLEEKSKSQEGTLQQQNQTTASLLKSPIKMEDNKGNKMTKDNNTNKPMRPILGQTSKSPSSTAQKDSISTQPQQQQNSSSHYILRSNGQGQGQKTKPADLSPIPTVLTPPCQTSDKVKTMQSLQKDKEKRSPSVQYRLQINKKPEVTQPHTSSGIDSITYEQNLVKASFSQMDNKKKSSIAPFEFDLLHPMASLEKYCKARGYRKPNYKCFHTSNLYQCHVKIDERIYSSYPTELKDEESAKLRSAEVAIEKLIEIESRNFLPKCHFTEKEFEMKIFEKLKNHPNGLMTKSIILWFEETFQQQIAKNWWSVLLNSSKLRMESSATSADSIVFAILDSESSLNNNNTGNMPSTEMPSSPTKPIPTNNSPLPPIVLPWGNKHWSLFITCCKSTTEIWARLYGKEYSEPYLEMSSDLQKLMANRHLLSSAQNVEQDEIYCAIHAVDGDWQRVKIESVDKAKGMCTCFFVDFGDSDTVPLGEIYHCTSRFKSLPAQAICLSLYELSDYNDYPYALRALYSKLHMKSFIAAICTKQNHYESIGGTVHGHLIKGTATRQGCIEVLLYDTSLPNEDINMIDVLAEELIAPAPKLTADLKSNPVVVTHVGDNGELYVVLANDNIRYLQNVISKIVASNFHREQHQAKYSDLTSDAIFLICDNISSPRGVTIWYRGMLTEKPHKPGDDAFDIYYVDIGSIHSTHISKIFRLNYLSTVLCKFPPQAIRVNLYDVPSMTITTVARLRGLLPPNTDALLKINAFEKHDGNYGIPMVTIFTLSSGGAYCAVNETLRIEHEFESLKQQSSETSTISSNHTCQDSTKSCDLLLRSDSHSSSQSVSSSNNSIVELTHSMQHLTTSNKAYLLKPLKDFEAIPALNAYFEIRISYSANPMFFVIQPYREYSQQLVGLMHELQEYCDNCKDYVPSDSIILGEAYATKNKDGFYHRAIALQTYGPTLRVKFVDFGDEAAVSAGRMKVLPAKFRQLPKMAVNAQLYGIKSIKDDWSIDVCARFRELTLGKKLIAIVHNVSFPDKDAQKAALLTLELFDTTTSKDIRIHELLIEEKSDQLVKDD